MLSIDPKKTALLIIDMQNDFCAPDGLSAKKGRGMRSIQNIITPLKEFQRTVRTLGVLTIYTRFIRKSPENLPQNLKILIGEAGLSPVCVEGTTGAELYEFIPEKDDIVVDKEYYDCFAQTKLLSLLTSRSIQTVLLTGVRTDICVDTTGKRALSEGFIPIIINDLVATTDQRRHIHDIVLETFATYHGFVLSSQEILSKLH